MPLYNIVHNSYIKVNNCKKNYFGIFNEPLDSKKRFAIFTSFMYCKPPVHVPKVHFLGGVVLPSDLKNIPELTHIIFYERFYVVHMAKSVRDLLTYYLSNLFLVIFGQG